MAKGELHPEEVPNQETIRVVGMFRITFALVFVIPVSRHLVLAAKLTHEVESQQACGEKYKGMEEEYQATVGAGSHSPTAAKDASKHAAHIEDVEEVDHDVERIDDSPARSTLLACLIAV